MPSVIDKFTYSSGKIARKVAADLSGLKTERKFADYNNDERFDKDRAIRAKIRAENLLKLYNDPNLELNSP